MFKKGMFWRESYLPNPLSYLHPAMLHQALPTDSPYYTNICSPNCRQTAVEVLSSLPPCLTSHSGGLWCSQLQHCTDRSTTVLPCLSLQHVWGAQLFNLCPWPQSPRTSSCNSTPTLFSATGIHCVKPEQGAASARRVINECKKMSSRVVLF